MYMLLLYVYVICTSVCRIKFVDIFSAILSSKRLEFVNERQYRALDCLRYGAKTSWSYKKSQFFLGGVYGASNLAILCKSTLSKRTKIIYVRTPFMERLI